MKKSETEAHGMPSGTFGKPGTSERIYRKQFKKFQKGHCHVYERHCDGILEVTKLEALRNQEKLALSKHMRLL